MSRANVDTVPINHEDLSDELIMLDPDNMVFSSTVRKGKKLKNVVATAPVDKRLSGRLGGLADGEDVDRSTVTNYQSSRDDLHCIIQHFRETHGVTALQQEAMDPAGIEDTFVDGRMKALVRLKEDQEYTFLSQQDHKKGSTAAGTAYYQRVTAAYHTRGASMWVDDTAQPNSTYVVPSDYRPVAALNKAVAGVSAITEASMRSMLMSLRSARKKPVNVSTFCTLEYGNRVDDFFTEGSTSGSVTPVRRFNSQGAVGTYEIGVTRYKTRYGTIDIIPTTFLNATRNAADTVTGAATTNGSPTVTFGSTDGMQPYMRISGTGIPAGAYILAVASATTITLSANATATGNPADILLGEYDHALYLDMEFFVCRTNKVPSGYEMPIMGGGRDGVVESMQSLFCAYPAVHGKHYTAGAPA